MSINRKIALISLVTFSLGTTLSANGASCLDYPYSVGMLPPEQDSSGSWKIVATGSADVQFDDVSSVNDARTEATMSAKAIIAKFLEEIVTGDDASTRVARQVVAKQKDQTGESKKVAETSVKESIIKLANSGTAVLRGALVIGDCYTPAKEYRVTVGIKPQTVQAAGSASNAINQSLSSQPTPTGRSQSSTTNSSGRSQNNTPEQNTSRSGSSMSNTPGYSNTQNLQKF